MSKTITIMINKFTRKFIQKPAFIALYLSLFSLAFIGAECEDIINALGGGEVAGIWQLQRQEGASQDICAGEVVEFREDGTAILQCPGQGVITRQYTLSGGILTFTSTGVEYNVSNPTTSTLVLDGRNVSRKLEYNKIITRPHTNDDKVQPSTHTSSEK